MGVSAAAGRSSAPGQEPSLRGDEVGSRGLPPRGFTATEFDRCAERLLEVIESSCDPGATFIEQLDTTLCACLDLLADDRRLAYLLTVAHLHQRELASAHERWVDSYALHLSRAAERLPRSSSPPAFGEPYLIGEVIWKIRGRVAGGIRQPLPHMRLDLMRLILPYYLGIEEADRIVGPSELRALGYLGGCETT